MQFYYIRHAQSANNLLWDRTGSSNGRSADPELSETGKQQAEHLARFLRQADSDIVAKGRDGQNVAGFRFTHLYTSLMARSVATGTAVAHALGLPLLAWEDLHEMGGIYLDDDLTGEPVGLPGKNRAYFEENYPDLVLPDTLGAAGWWNRPMETREQGSVRAQRFVHELLQRHGDSADRVAVISHGGFYNHVLAAVLGMPRIEDFWFVLNNAAITRIDFDGDAIYPVYFNRADFMPRDLVT
jgi:2,3-bisphosphoglycerate-dependent phosphoglycerate mutase